MLTMSCIIKLSFAKSLRIFDIFLIPNNGRRDDFNPVTADWNVRPSIESLSVKFRHVNA